MEKGDGTMQSIIMGQTSTGSCIPVTVGSTGNLQVDLASALSAALDSMDVSKMSKGVVTAAHTSAIANGTSAEISWSGYNSVYVEVYGKGSATGTVTLFGAVASGGNFGTMIDHARGTAMQFVYSESGTVTGGCAFKGIPDAGKSVLTRGAGTISVNILPLNL